MLTISMPALAQPPIMRREHPRAAGKASAKQSLPSTGAEPPRRTTRCNSARKYDPGDGDGYCPFRPRFYVMFWPSLNWVQVRFVGENGFTSEIEDLRYNLNVKD